MQGPFTESPRPYPVGPSTQAQRPGLAEVTSHLERGVNNLETAAGQLLDKLSPLLIESASCPPKGQSEDLPRAMSQFEQVLWGMVVRVVRVADMLNETVQARLSL
jgi:hypothetical protein